jgi:hypothetical protein
MGYLIKISIFIIISLIISSIIYISLPKDESDHTKTPKSILGGSFLGLIAVFVYYKYKSKLKLSSYLRNVYLEEDFDD